MTPPLSQRLQAARRRKQLTIRELAAILHRDHSTISGYETGRRSPDPQTLVSLCTALDVSADHLLGLDVYAVQPAPQPRVAERTIDEAIERAEVSVNGDGLTLQIRVSCSRCKPNNMRR
jgi:transcriptional regulator with XRE-family HTH domain